MSGFAVVGLPDVYLSSLGAFLDAFVLIRRQVAAVFRARERIEMQTRVYLLSPDGGPVHMADGRHLIADDGLQGNPTVFDLVHIPGFVVGSEEVLNTRLAGAGSLCRWLRQQSEAGALISASGTAVFMLAEAGLLDGGTVAISRPLIPLFRRRYSRIRVSHGSAVVEHQNILTGSGLAADAQLLTRLVERVASPELARWLGDVTGLRPGGEEHIADDPLIANAQVWLEDRFAQNIRISELAEAMSVTQQTLLRHFRHHLNTTPQAYLRKVRVDAARRMLLRTTRSVGQIGSLVGYNDLQSFRKAFKQLTGVSPSRYRTANTTSNYPVSTHGGEST